MTDSYDTSAIDSIAVSRLWAAKPPLPGESCASWIQRLCGDHQYSFRVFKQVLGHAPSKFDWDLLLPSSAWDCLAGLVGIPGLMLKYSGMSLLGALSRTSNSSELMRMVDDRPAYRWCPSCLAEDEIPHLRWYWRLDGVHECWVHKAPLNEKCLVCGQPIFVHRAQLTNRFASFLSECAECGMGLSGPVHQARRYHHESQRKLQSILAPWWLSGRSLNNDEAVWLAAKCHYVIKDRWRLANARFDANLRRREELVRQEKLWVLDANCFQEGATPKVEKNEKFRTPWQWQVNPTRRLAVAEALWTIRGELRAIRAEGDVP